ncbi:MAG: class II aldolase/adducin family protein [Myxococcales bacterium]|nr:class II aldolase/adducin family protein [Myxococcales bacterium]
MNLSDDALRQQLCDAGRQLYARGLIGPTDGNFSALGADGAVLCSPSGCHKGALSPAQIVRVDRTGAPLGPGRPSSELKLHLALYAARPWVRCIVHAHPPTAVGLTVAGAGLDPPMVPEILFAMGRCPTVAYASPTTHAVAEGVLSVIGEAEAFLLARHGSVVLGLSLDDAVMKTEVIEHTAKITLAALQAGPATPLSEAELTRILTLRAALGSR